VRENVFKIVKKYFLSDFDESAALSDQASDRTAKETRYKKKELLRKNFVFEFGL
jgi:hypothetical protein